MPETPPFFVSQDALSSIIYAVFIAYKEQSSPVLNERGRKYSGYFFWDLFHQWEELKSQKHGLCLRTYWSVFLLKGPDRSHPAGNTEEQW